MPAGQTQTGGTQSIVASQPISDSLHKQVNGRNRALSLARSLACSACLDARHSSSILREARIGFHFAHTNEPVTLRPDAEWSILPPWRGSLIKRKKYPHECSVHPASYRLAQKALGYQRYQRSRCRRRRPSVRALSLFSDGA